MTDVTSRLHKVAHPVEQRGHSADGRGCGRVRCGTPSGAIRSCPSCVRFRSGANWPGRGRHRPDRRWRIRRGSRRQCCRRPSDIRGRSAQHPCLTSGRRRSPPPGGSARPSSTASASAATSSKPEPTPVVGPGPKPQQNGPTPAEGLPYRARLRGAALKVQDSAEVI